MHFQSFYCSRSDQTDKASTHCPSSSMLGILTPPGAPQVSRLFFFREVSVMLSYPVSTCCTSWPQFLQSPRPPTAWTATPCTSRLQLAIPEMEDYTMKQLKRDTSATSVNMKLLCTSSFVILPVDGMLDSGPPVFPATALRPC